GEQWRISPQRRERLEQQRQIRMLTQDAGREALEAAVTANEPGRRDCTDTGDARIPVRDVPDEGEKIRNQRRLNAKLFEHPHCIADLLGLAVNLHDTRV